MEKIIKELYETIINRKEAGNDGSYTKYLLDKGTNKILKKVGEECTEVIISCKEDNKEEQINEFADLIYHLLVLMVDRSISIKEIEEELKEKYSVDNLFKNRQKAKEDEILQQNNSLLVIEEEKWYKKLFNIIKKFFSKGR